VIFGGAWAGRESRSLSSNIVMAVSDPVGSGLVTSLAHPGGNVTGLAMLHTELAAKRLQLLKETIPHLIRVAVLWNPATPSHPKAIDQLKAAAPSLSIELTFVNARTPEQLRQAVLAASRAEAQALYMMDDPVFSTHRMTLLKLASKARLPVISSQKDLGGLMSYGANFGDAFRRSAGYVDQILRGAKPGDLPIEQPTKFELVVNLKNAKALGLTIPESILLQADEVIR
jgi:putative ABC transport system substrate-binding protein